jgi:PAS domain S-box-containing protein
MHDATNARGSSPELGPLADDHAEATPRFRAVFASSLDPMLLVDDLARYVDANPAACTAFGYTVEQFRAADVSLLLPPETKSQLGPSWPKFLQKQSEDGRITLCTRLGERRVFDYRAVTHILPGLHLSVLRDVTDQELAAIALAQREQHFRTLADHIPDPVFVLDLEGETAGAIRYLNRAVLQTYGYREEELLGHSLIERLDTPAMAAAAPARLAQLRQLKDGETATFRGSHRRRDGSELPVEAHVCRIVWHGRTALLAIDRNITERVEAERQRERLEAQLLQSQKLEAVGLLAGGVAHDFNNILTAVMGFADLLVGELAATPSARELATQIRQAADRGAHLTRQLLAFSRKQVVRAAWFDPAAVLADMAPMLQRLLEAHVRLEVRAEATGSIHADQGQFQQVVMNLVINARDAMPRGGVIELGTAPAILADGTAGIRLRVRDTGVGMPPAVRARLFEPFFTTKPLGKGTGLGLATVYGIVTQAGGTVQVDSEEGVGTTFDILWPRRNPNAAATEVRADATITSHRAATILLVEDDDGSRELAARILRQLGHDVLVAATAEAALALAQSSAALDLLVTDVMLPGCGGRQLAERMLAARPSLRVLFVSGFISDDMLRHDVTAAKVTLLAKPYTAAQLASAVQTGLGR